MGTTFWRWSCAALGLVSIASILCVGTGASVGISVVDDAVAASVFGQQSGGGNCGLNAFSNWTEPRCQQSRVDLCTHLSKSQCAMGLCAYDCTQTVTRYAVGIWNMRYTAPPCPATTTLTCTPGWLYGCNCTNPTIAVVCFNNTSNIVACAAL